MCHKSFLQITGDANEEQVLLSVQAYQDKPNLLTKAFNNLFNLFRVSSVKSQCAALEVMFYSHSFTVVILSFLTDMSEQTV